MLTPQNRLFAEIYLKNGLNARAAYFEAYPNADKTNKNPSYPYCLLKKPELQEYIQQRREEIYESLKIDGMRVAERLAEIAFSAKEDEVYNTSYKLKALELLQKQLGLQNQKINTRQEIIEVSVEGEEDET